MKPTNQIPDYRKDKCQHVMDEDRHPKTGCDGFRCDTCGWFTYDAMADNSYCKHEWSTGDIEGFTECRKCLRNVKCYHPDGFVADSEDWYPHPDHSGITIDFRVCELCNTVAEHEEPDYDEE